MKQVKCLIAPIVATLLLAACSSSAGSTSNADALRGLSNGRKVPPTQTAIAWQPTVQPIPTEVPIVAPTAMPIVQPTPQPAPCESIGDGRGVPNIDRVIGGAAAFVAKNPAPVQIGRIKFVSAWDGTYSLYGIEACPDGSFAVFTDGLLSIETQYGQPTYIFASVQAIARAQRIATRVAGCMAGAYMRRYYDVGARLIDGDVYRSEFSQSAILRFSGLMSAPEIVAGYERGVDYCAEVK